MAAPAASAAAAASEGWIVPRLQKAALELPFVRDSATLKMLLSHPAGPFTIHFWAPTTKWLISAANIADLHRPVEKMSMGQQAAVGTTGVIWSYVSTRAPPRAVRRVCLPAPALLPRPPPLPRGPVFAKYSMCITPVNYNLLVVNAVMACTSTWHLGRMVDHYYLHPPPKEGAGGPSLR